MSPLDRLHVAVLCFPSVGGSGVIAVEVGLALAGRGHRVHFVGRAPPSRWPTTPPPGLSFHAVRARSAQQGGDDVVELASALVELARAERIDLVHAHYAAPHATSAWMARTILAGSNADAAPRIVTTLHGTDVTAADAAQQPVTIFAVAASDVVTAPSEFLRGAALSQLGLRAPIEVVPNFVDEARYRPRVDGDDPLRALFPERTEQRAPVLVHVSNFRPVKRVDDVVSTFALVRRSRPARLVMIGDGPDRRAAQDRVTQLGLADDVVFLGKQDDFATTLAACDVFLLPSASESFGLAALEAMSSGVPVIASDVGGVPEVIDDGVTGLLAPVGDVDAFARHALWLLNDDARWTAFSKAARARVMQRFRQEPAIDAYEAVYRRVLRRAATSTP